ncbi:hypothetical protein C8T65DRAFT_666804 [Cerioporus squamosus]|nr:hypothetical protein C8T65DRAFT_666804 [Cerioporus squamosus]
MAVCQFFLRGTCKFGNNCRNEHPRDGQRQGGFGNQSWTASGAGTSAPVSTATLFTFASPPSHRPLLV